MIKTDISLECLCRRVEKQLEYVAGYEHTDIEQVTRYVKDVLPLMSDALEPCKIKHTKSEGKTIFSTMHIGQYAMFLWFMARNAFDNGEYDMANSLSYLNSSMNSIFLIIRLICQSIFIWIIL